MNTLNKLHNLMLNSSSRSELRTLVFNLSLDNIYNNHYDNVFNSTIENPVLAGKCSVLPIYYFKASKTSGKKQDRFGQFYKSQN